LFELLLAIALMALIFAMALPFGLEFYRRNTLDAERENLAAVLRQARGRAMANIRETPHGVRIAPEGYTVFEGDSYAARDPAYDTLFPKDAAIVASGLAEVVFSELQGNANASGTVSLESGGGRAELHINYEGRID